MNKNLSEDKSQIDNEILINSCKYIDKLIEQEGKQMNISHEIKGAISDITISYLDTLLKYSDHIAEVKSAKNITSDIIRIACSIMEEKQNLVSNDEIITISEIIKPPKLYQVNSDDSIIKRFN